MSKTDFLFSSKEYFSEMVDKACLQRKVSVHAGARNYLVQLLEHYMDARNLNDKHQTLAEAYLTANQAPPTEKHALLKKLGDKSLYISGFFADSLNRKVVDIDYYINMGGAAYGELADVVHEDTIAAIYRVFSKRFLEFVEVLNYISQKSMLLNDQNILNLYDRYLKTGSMLAQEQLAELGVFTLPADQVKLSRQD